MISPFCYLPSKPSAEKSTFLPAKLYWRRGILNYISRGIVLYYSTVEYHIEYIMQRKSCFSVTHPTLWLICSFISTGMKLQRCKRRYGRCGIHLKGQKTILLIMLPHSSGDSWVFELLPGNLLYVYYHAV